MSAVSYIALSPQDMDDLLRKAAERPDMVSASTAKEMFDVSAPFLDVLVKEGRIRKYVVPGHTKSVRYKVSELTEAFKPIHQ
jgi:hypothetical protein